MMPPRVAIDNLVDAVLACDLAVECHVADGYQVLLIGQQRAREGERNFERVRGAAAHAWAPVRAKGGGRGAGRAVRCGAGAVYGAAGVGSGVRGLHGWALSRLLKFGWLRTVTELEERLGRT
jgi:hypothetical protein